MIAIVAAVSILIPLWTLSLRSPDKQQTDFFRGLCQRHRAEQPIRGGHPGYVVYVNYGDAKDFDVLVNGLGFDVGNESVIALVRYGALLRGIKALNAAEYGFKAVMLFSDPEDYGDIRGDVLPDGVSMKIFVLNFQIYL